MGPSEDRASPSRKQACRRPAPARPRARRCLLKGCERWFPPACSQARYCSTECRGTAARWREWKARGRYRQTERSRECRRAQRQRGRQRQAERERRGERRAEDRVGASAWVIAQQEIFMLVRPSWLLRDVRTDTPVTDAAILLAAVPACARMRARARTPVAEAVAGAIVRAVPASAFVSGAYCP